MGNKKTDKISNPLNIPLDERSKELRRLVIRALKGGKRGHIGASLSPIEILRVLYDDVLRYRSKDPEWPGRDRFILSKGHGCLAQYIFLAEKGFIPFEELDRFCHLDSMLGGHPDASKIPGVETSTGALGHGLPIALGFSLAALRDKTGSRIFVVMGDGECNEGSVWEAAMIASKHKLSNLIAIVDYNKMQSYDTTYKVMDLEPFADKWRAFGFAVEEVNGHDVQVLRDLFARLPFQREKPNAVICHTVKGKGIGFAENNLEWHHKSRLSEKDIEMLLTAIGEY